MKRNVLVCLAVVTLSGCAGTKYAVHPHKRGSIISVESNTATVCIADNETINTGNRYDVYKVIKHKKIERGYPVTYEFVRTGSIEIAGVNDGHFASATILDGEVKSGQNITQKP